MKKALLLVLFCLVAGLSFARTSDPVTRDVNDSTLQPSGQVNVNFEGQTNYGSIGAWGADTSGNPGYIVLKGCNDANACFPYYLWIGQDGKLKQASYITISNYASFPSGTWTGSSMGGSNVGSQ